MSDHLSANVQRFMGFADCYDANRPTPPAVLTEVLRQIAGIPQGKEANLIVDIGSGTGLSTRLWAAAARRVIGIEPGADMRRQAQAATAMANVEYREGTSSATGLPDGAADIVTCSQSLHWMEPQPTFAEIARILRPGGVFAAVDCDWPPVTRWQADAAYHDFEAHVGELERRHGVSADVQKWPKAQHLQRIRDSGRFAYCREILLHQIETSSADRLVGMALSQGSVRSLLKAGLSESEIGLDKFRGEIGRIIGDVPFPWYFSYRVRVGVKGER